MSIKMVFQLDADLTLRQLVFEKRVPQQLLCVWPLFVIFYQTVIDEADKLLWPVCSWKHDNVCSTHTNNTIDYSLMWWSTRKPLIIMFTKDKLLNTAVSTNTELQAFLTASSIIKHSTRLTTFLFWALVLDSVESETRPSLDVTRIMLQKHKHSTFDNNRQYYNGRVHLHWPWPFSKLLTFLCLFY